MNDATVWNVWFGVTVALVILARIFELIHSKRNERWLKSMGAIEYGRAHYVYIVAMHVAFFVSLILEYVLVGPVPVVVPVLISFAVVIGLKVWVVLSLGRYWNTRIYRIPGSQLVRTGPYRWLKHPNYLLVVCELALLPLAFHMYLTAVIFTVVNAVALYVRISEENRVLV